MSSNGKGKMLIHKTVVCICGSLKEKKIDKKIERVERRTLHFCHAKNKIPSFRTNDFESLKIISLKRNKEKKSVLVGGVKLNKLIR